MAGNVPVLSPALEKKIKKSIRDLSLVEGNLISGKKDLKSVYVSSCFKGEGKTTSAISMAYGLAVHGGAGVLLVDGNLRKPSLHNHFSTTAAPGLAEWMRGEAAEKVIQPTHHAKLALMTAGQPQANYLELFGSEDFKHRLQGLAGQFDYLVFDGHPVLESSEPSLIAGAFDAMVMVVECERTKWEVVQIALEKVDKIGGQVVGVVLNKRKFYVPKFFYGMM